MPVITQPIRPTTPVGAVPPTLADAGLTPGAVVSAQVLAARAENVVRIAIAGLIMDVMTEVKLQPGTQLTLAVSQNGDGLKLAIVEQRAAGQAANTPPALATSAAAAAQDDASAGARIVSTAATLSGSAVPPAAGDAKPAGVSSLQTAAASQTPVATPTQAVAVQAAAVAQAVRAAAPLQASLAPLFANLPVIVASAQTPPDVRQAGAQLLAARPVLDETLNAATLRDAVKTSGLLMEATLARGVAAAPAAVPAAAPDLKAALIVFRQVLSQWAAAAPPPTGQVSAPAQPGALAPSTAPIVVAQVAVPATAAAGVMPAPVMVGATVQTSAPVNSSPPLAPGTTPPQAGATPAIQKPDVPQANAQAAATPVPLPEHADAVGDAAQQRLPGAPVIAATLRNAANNNPAAMISDNDALPAALPREAAATVPVAKPAAEPAPPFRGGTPSPQPIASPSIAPDMPAASMAARLIEQTDGALARQTLLQAASLPDRIDAPSSSQPQSPRWNFEIPFAHPHGTAVAQFEIAQDGGGSGAEGRGSARIWRARFTLDVETTGPVHALVSLIGETTTVRLWAERAETAMALRAQSASLDSALRQAALEPGDISIAEGAPPMPKPARAGHFLDRAT